MSALKRCSMPPMLACLCVGVTARTVSCSHASFELFAACSEYIVKRKGVLVPLDQVWPQQQEDEPFSCRQLVVRHLCTHVCRATMFCLIYIEDLTLWYMPAVAASALQLLMQGRLVAAFLERFFHQWVSDYTFTNDMEEQLDSISAGSLKLSQTLGVFWNKLTADLESVKDVRMQQVCVFGPGLTELF